MSDIQNFILQFKSVKAAFPNINKVVISNTDLSICNLNMEGALKNNNIWQEAMKERSKQPQAASLERILIVLGNASVGKTSFIKVLKNQPDTQVKPTFLLQYSYIRKGFVRKQLIHCYDIASKSQSDIIPSLFTKDNFLNVTVALCLDLSKPGTLIEQVNQWVSIIKKQVQSALHEKAGMQEKYNQWLIKRKEENSSHQDAKTINTAAISLVLVGCKYDLYQKYETENRKWLSKTLRYLAHANNASLVFSSTKNPAVGSQLRSVLFQLMFEEKAKIASQKDHLKPIFIYRNQDSFGNIGVPTSGSIGGIQVLRRQLAGLFGAEEEKKKEGTDVAKYFEAKIQNLITQRKKEFAKIARGSRKNIM